MAEKKYLDNSGLSQFWQLIKSKIPTLYASSKSAGGPADKAVSIPFGQVDSTSTSTAFTATVNGITELRDGVCVYLQNGVVTSASGCTLDINNLGAKPMYASNAAASGVAKVFSSSYTMLFVYNSSRIEGGCWDMYYGYDSNSNTIGYQLRTNSTSLPMAQKVYRYRLLFTSADGTHWVGANTSTSTNATAKRTPNQTKIDPFGKIVYYGYTSAIDADTAPGASYMWSQYVATLGYSFNSTGEALELTYPRPVYIKCAPQADGSAIIDSTTPYVQALPSTADGKIYIFLGVAVSETTVEIVPEHPIYCYRNGRLQLWTGIQQEIDALTIPSNLSDLNNDAGYVTSSEIPVTSVNGQTGAVTLTIPSNAADVGALPSNTTYVTSVNGSSGVVTLTIPSTAEDVGALPSNTTYVSSVNGSSGAVTVPIYDDTALSSRVSAIEALESGWNAKYIKPSNGIPASDLASGVIPDVSDVIRYSVQSLTTVQQAQARENINSDEIFVLKIFYDNSNQTYDWITNYSDWVAAQSKYKFFILALSTIEYVEYYYSYKTLRFNNMPLALFTQTNIISSDAIHLNGANINALYFVDTDNMYDTIVTATFPIASTDYVQNAVLDKITSPSAPNDGDFLTWSSSASAWIAKTLASWTGGSY